MIRIKIAELLAKKIDILCKVLHCQVGDILEYVEEEES